MRPQLIGMIVWLGSQFDPAARLSLSGLNASASQSGRSIECLTSNGRRSTNADSTKLNRLAVATASTPGVLRPSITCSPWPTPPTNIQGTSG